MFFFVVAFFLHSQWKLQNLLLVFLGINYPMLFYDNFLNLFVIIFANNNNHFSNYLLKMLCLAHIIFKKNSYSIKLGKDISYWTQTTDKLIPMLSPWWQGREINITIYYYWYHWLQNISDFTVTCTLCFDSKNTCNTVSYGYNQWNNIFHIEIFFP